MRICLEDIIEKHDYVNVIKTKDGYRIHDFVSGMILKVNRIAALVMLLLDGLSYEQLQLKIKEELGKEFMNYDDLNELLVNLHSLKLIKIIKRNSGPRVLLIQPCYQYPNEVYRKIRITPPLGILSIGTVLYEKGYDVHLLDMLVEELRPNDLKARLETIKPDIVGISMNFTATANVCYEIAQELRKLSIKAIFVGGNHATFTYDEVLENQNIDFVVRFQGEDTVPELIDAIWRCDEESIQKCKGIAFKKNGEIIVNDRCPMTQDLNWLPLPAWELLPIHRYNEDERWVIYTSQGCPCACTFCSTSAFNSGKKVISMSVDEILRRIRHIIKLSYGESIPIIGFCDDAFTHNRKRVIELCECIIKENLKFIWSCNTRVDLIDENLIDLMYSAGCRAILFGIESCSDKVLKAVGKKIDIEQAKRAVEIAKKRGMRIREMFILGLPYEDYESLDLMEKFFNDTEPHEIRFGLLSVYPGTPLWYHGDKFGINILTKNWTDYDLLKPTSNNTILNEEEIYTKYIELTEKYEKKMLHGEIEIM